MRLAIARECGQEDDGGPENGVSQGSDGCESGCQACRAGGLMTEQAVAGDTSLNYNGHVVWQAKIVRHEGVTETVE